MAKRGPSYIRKGQRLGEEHGRARLTNEQVKEIRRIYVWRHPEFGVCALARRFNVGKETVRQIVLGKTWASV